MTQMKFRFCRASNENGMHGDCIAACIKTLVNRDDVPHVFDDRPPLESWAELRAWLAAINRTIILFPVEDFEEHKQFMSMNNPDISYMLLHATANGDHATIYRNGKLVHDPAWTKSAITGPHSIGCYIIAFIGELV